MDENVLKGKWKQVRGSVKKQWGKLTDDQLDQIEGDRDKLVGKLQEEYGYSKQEAEQQVDQFLREQ